jgi:uncharacterized sodium:solute symporter family permease YidK
MGMLKGVWEICTNEHFLLHRLAYKAKAEGQKGVTLTDTE